VSKQREKPTVHVVGASKRIKRTKTMKKRNRRRKRAARIWQQ
jgi:hypothetical protein